MKRISKNMARAVIAMVMVMVMMLTACGNNTNTAPEKEQTISMNQVTQEDKDSVTMESATEVETEDEEVEEESVVTDGEYAVYPAFIKTFTVTDNVLKVETENPFEDYEMPTEMDINFEYPLATDIVWTDNVAKITEEDDWYGWFSFYLEGIKAATERYNDGMYEGTYASGEDFCKANAVWTFVIEDETVQSISMNLVESNEEVEATETATEVEPEATETEAKAETTPAPSAKEDTTASNPAPVAPVHTHSYSSSVTKQATCGSNGVKTFTCSCGDSYTESISGGDHNWVPRYGTIEHASQGEMRQVQTGSTGETYICNVCGAEFSSKDDYLNHKRSLIGVDNLHATSSYTIRDGQPTYTNEWVVTQEAWTETIVIGYDCSICGATR